ncbi:N-acetylglucosamine-6-phosphate deacetylase [Sphingobacterium bovisgrunnientis]|uniref:N-acetylglucosamine-6-phosphate deacetylase n=1 Tax=Sphingobacterium bovisgrunnientis TaxID=1874697 RepID=UPI001359B58E|nr:N-acetylglucosamine-6-phosphate deacetylase [Sphingobacterium bovisgrunnientis]
MTKLLLYNGRLITEKGILESAYCFIEGGIIKDYGVGIIEVCEGTTRINVENKYISAGFIDIHIHGGGGYDFMDADIESFLGVANTHIKYGTTSMCPTTLTADSEHLEKVLAVYEQANLQNANGSKFLGLHLEGPYFAINQRGAQDPKYIRNPDYKEYSRIVEMSPHIIRWSAAPELLGALEFGDFLTERGIIAAFAHTEALYDDIKLAFDHGYRLATHFYSAMLGVTRKNAHRYAGAVEACYLIEEMDVEVIADGVHLPRPLLELIYKIKGADRIVLITDAMRAAGTQVNKSILGSLQDGIDVIVEDGVAKLVDRSAFAGSIATANLLVRTFLQNTKASLPEVIKMITVNPARIMKLAHRKGLIESGYDADVVVFDENIDVYLSIVEGYVKYNKLSFSSNES